MGAMCNTASIEKSEVLMNDDNQSRVVILKKYQSNNDKPYNAFESRHNLLQYIKLTEYSMIFNQFKFDNVIQNGMTSKRKLFSENIEKTDYLSFFKVKIVNHHILQAMDLKFDSSQIFMDFLEQLFDVVCKGIKSFIKNYNTRNNTQIKDRKPKKFILVAFGLLFCESDNATKIDYLFDVFCNEQNKIEVNYNLELFLFVLILIASYGSITAIDELFKTYPNDISEVNQEDFLKTHDIYAVDDMMHVEEEFIKSFFGNSKGLTYSEYREKIINDGFDWFLNGPGIRFKLEEKDIQHPDEPFEN